MAVSIFSEASLQSITDPTGSHILGSTGIPICSVHLASSAMSATGEALFALATNAGSVVMIKLPPYGLPGK